MKLFRGRIVELTPYDPVDCKTPRKFSALRVPGRHRNPRTDGKGYADPPPGKGTVSRTNPIAAARCSGTGVFLRAALIGVTLIGVGSAFATQPVEPALVVDVETGIILHAESPDRPWYPASLAKMMTLYLALEALAVGKLAPEDRVAVSALAARQPPTRLGLATGNTIAVADAIDAVAAVSANDAAVVIAEAVAQDVRAFVRRMTATARALGMRDTKFRNPTGLPDPGQVTTARDMAMLGRRLLRDFPDHYRIFSQRSFEFAGRTRLVHNRLLGSYPGADGIKTGFTCAAGFNLVASAQRDGRRLLGVGLGGASRYRRDRRMAALLDAAFLNSSAGPELGRLAHRPQSHVANSDSPPTRLGSEACARLTGPARLVPGNIPGWGLLLGVHAEKQQGRAALREARAALAPGMRPGRSVLLRRNLEHGTSWKVLLVGYRQADAGRACKHLSSRGRTCVVQSPQVMNSPGYELR